MRESGAKLNYSFYSNRDDVWLGTSEFVKNDINPVTGGTRSS